MESSDDTAVSVQIPTDSSDEAFCSACGRSFAPELAICPDDGARLVRFRAKGDPMIGRMLDERYEVRAPLGRGGMGTVYRAWQLSVDRAVAIKVVHASLANDRLAAKRFLREARLASRLSQPNIVNVYDFGQTDDGVLYLVMELLRGVTLADELTATPQLSIKRASNIVLQLCDALESAHNAGIIHRDLKPGNIVLLDGPTDRQPVKVLDFGLAKSLVADSDSHVTQTDAILGTPLYMSPEAVQGKPTDQRGDIYALGCIFHEMLSGRPPFLDASVNVVMMLHANEPPPMLASHVPMALAELVLSMMAKAPEHRVQTAAAVREQLQTILDAETEARLLTRMPTPVLGSLKDLAAKAMTPPSMSLWPTSNRLPAAPTGMVAPVAHAAPSTPDAPSSSMITTPTMDAVGGRSTARWWLAGVGALLVGAAAFAVIKGAAHEPGPATAAMPVPNAAAAIVIDAAVSPANVVTVTPIPIDAAIAPSPIPTDAAAIAQSQKPPDTPTTHAVPHAHLHPPTTPPTSGHDLDFYPASGPK